MFDLLNPWLHLSLSPAFLTLCPFDNHNVQHRAHGDGALSSAGLVPKHVSPVSY
jgi:hypothetical protein